MSLWSLLGFAAWTLLLVSAVVVYRTAVVFAGKRRANTWGRNQPSQDPEILQRLSHAHANCVENLPVFAAVILVAGLTHKLELTDPLAGWYLALRICQSTVHVIGTSHRQVSIRATFFMSQLLLLAWMMARLAGVL